MVYKTLISISVSMNGGLTAAALVSGYAVVIGIFFIMIIIIGCSSYISPLTYDTTKFRYARIRNQLVEMLKNVEMFSSQQTKEILEQIKVLDEIISERGKYKNALTHIVDFFTPGSGKIADDLKFQRLLESLSANDLYIRAASLKTL